MPLGIGSPEMSHEIPISPVGNPPNVPVAEQDNQRDPVRCGCCAFQILVPLGEEVIPENGLEIFVEEIDILDVVQLDSFDGVNITNWSVTAVPFFGFAAIFDGLAPFDPVAEGTGSMGVDIGTGGFAGDVVVSRTTAFSVTDWTPYGSLEFDVGNLIFPTSSYDLKVKVKTSGGDYTTAASSIGTPFETFTLDLSTVTGADLTDVTGLEFIITVGSVVFGPFFFDDLRLEP